MKILQICHKPPYPPKDGGTRAMHNITMGLLSRGHEVKVLTAYTDKHEFELKEIPEGYIKATDIEAVYIDTRVNAIEAFASLITSDSYNISRFFSTDLDLRLTRILKKEKFDIIQLESLFVSPYLTTIRRHSNAKVILRSHNIEYRIWRELAENSKNIAKRAYLKYLSKKLEEYETSIIDQVDGIAAISKSDYQNFYKLGYKKKMRIVPFAMEGSKKEYEEIKKEKALCYIGSMDWKPNQEGLIWFLEEIWPYVHEAHPELAFYVAGRSLPDYIRQLDAPNVHFLGEVEDARRFLASYSVLVVPLLLSGGLRVRVIEAMSVGSCVITTRYAANGLKYKEGTNLLLADSAEEFCEVIQTALFDNDQALKIGEAARGMVNKHYNIETVLDELEALYREVSTLKRPSKEGLFNSILFVSY